jgi:DNA mismatch repair protein MutL
LASPQAAFTLIENGRVIFRSPECATLAERVAEIFGRQTAESLMPIQAEEDGMRLHGLIGRPGVGRATRHEMVVFVNQRPVDSRTLNYALIESYHESLPKGRYPLAFVFFACEPAQVDVNVHPAKREVRFRSEPAVRAFVIRSVLSRLREYTAGNSPAAAVAQPAIPVNSPGVVPPAAPAPVSRPATDQAPSSRAPAISRALPPSPTAPVKPVAGPQPTPAAPAKPSSPTPDWRFVGLAHGNFALFETEAGLVLLDRRAAHERIWFERLQEQFRSGQVPSQRLLLPVPMELDPIASALLLDRLDFLSAHGFEVSEFGRNFFRIEALPAWMEPGDAEGFMRDLLGMLRDGRLQGKNVDLARDELARLAVVKAVRLPESAREPEIRALLGQLMATSHPLTNPAGRPTYIELNHAELARRFQKLT